MKKLVERIIIPVMIGMALLFAFAGLQKAYGGTAMLVGEKTLDNWTKVCIYERLGKTYTLTISELRWCPMTLEVDD